MPRAKGRIAQPLSRIQMAPSWRSTPATKVGVAKARYARPVMVRSVPEYGRTADRTPSAAARIAETTRARSISSRVAGIAARIGSIASTPLLVALTPQSPWTKPVSHFQ